MPTLYENMINIKKSRNTSLIQRSLLISLTPSRIFFTLKIKFEKDTLKSKSSHSA